MNVIITDLSWGDSGKGRLVDLIAEDFDMVVRAQAGPNAGHTIVVNGEKYILRHIPSGVLHDNVKCVLAAGMVLDLTVLADEISTLQKRGVDLKNKLLISDKAHIIFPSHKDNDDKDNKIGTTKKGIGPAYSDKINRIGKRLSDVIIDAKEFEQELKIIKPFVTDTTYLINSVIDGDGSVLFECSQGALLDIDMGTYPYVTSSNTTAGGICTGSGVGPTRIDDVVGITKAYFTRVGEGPFPTELNGDIADKLREAGDEYGSVTKRPRRVGWIDIPILKYGCMINGADAIVLTKLDVLSGMDEVKVCTGYGDDDFSTDILPSNLNNVKPVYKTFPGWSEDISKIRSLEELPANAKAYVEFIENEVGVPITLISVGPEREQIIQTQILEVAEDYVLPDKTNEELYPMGTEWN